MESEQYLRRWYREYNYRYFAGELDDYDVDIFLTPCGRDDECYGFIFCHAGSYSVDLGIDDMLIEHEKFARIILLHEMIHVKLQPYGLHGKPFYAEFVRLATEGAYAGLI